ncbi:Uncharacterised protein [Serratia grimesii]|jgi:hypothetical protein|nr:Uncharacterised protein [Serratia grimesii]CAI0870609.1 Uncharacterised protein [Serratia grimesii]CAI1115605.1 Uncharacterised protein [Serratia grimesii]CAI1566822.1 Uncharacterised protein [Serratia grimesii]CAI2437359.1 Uncharacterised protein [Serratia grimesii]
MDWMIFSVIPALLFIIIFSLIKYFIYQRKKAFKPYRHKR